MAVQPFLSIKKEVDSKNGWTAIHSDMLCKISPHTADPQAAEMRAQPVDGLEGGLDPGPALVAVDLGGPGGDGHPVNVH